MAAACLEVNAVTILLPLPRRRPTCFLSPLSRACALPNRKWRKRTLTFVAQGCSAPNKNPEPFYEFLQPSSTTSDIAGTVNSNLSCRPWLPSPPEMPSPRAIYNATSLAYLGDCIYELYARRHFLFPPLGINEYNRRVMALVCCEAQDTLLKLLLKDNFLSDEERDIVRWGRNIESGKTKTTRRAGSAVYNRASSLETLIGFLYLTDSARLDAVMQRLGFCVDRRKKNFDELNIYAKEE